METKHEGKGARAQAAEESCSLGDAPQPLCTGLEGRGGTAPAALSDQTRPRANPPLRSHRSPSSQGSQSGLDLCPGFRENQSFRLLGMGRITKTHQHGELTSLEEMKRQAVGGRRCKKLRQQCGQGRDASRSPSSSSPGSSRALGWGWGRRLELGRLSWLACRAVCVQRLRH